VLEDIGADMEVLGSSPMFNCDWRWFKSLYGDARRFNESYRESFLANSHNFVDYRQLYAPRTATENTSMDRLCYDLHGAAVVLEKHLAQGGEWTTAAISPVLDLIAGLEQELAEVSPHFSDALKEAGDALANDHLNARAISQQKYFNGLFGRETIYVSFTRKSQ
jgi:hypothetical protein